MKNRTEYLIISIISIFFSLYITEGYLTYQQAQNYKNYKKETGKNYDKRKRIEVYEDRKKINKEVKMRVSPYNFYIDVNRDYKLYPLSGVSNSETVYCNENGYYFIFQSDRYGFNNPDTEWNIKEIEYLLVGDSFTMGACVNRPDDIGSQLRKLSNKSALNLGYAGNGPLINLATLKEYLNPNVKEVFWFHFEGNDLLDFTDELKNKILRNYLNDLNFSQNLKEKQKELDIIINLKLENTVLERDKNNKYSIDREKKIKKEIVKEIAKESLSYQLINFIKLSQLRNRKIINFLKNGIARNDRLKSDALKYFAQKRGGKTYYELIMEGSLTMPSRFEPFIDEYVAQLPVEFRKLLEMVQKLTVKNGSKLYFVYLPEHERYRNEGYKGQTIFYSSIKNIINKLEIPFIDIHEEVFKKENDPLKLFPFKLSGHYNAEGYAKIAEILYKYTAD